MNHPKLYNEDGNVLTSPSPITGAFAGFGIILEIGRVEKDGTVTITKTRDDVRKSLITKLRKDCSPFPALGNKINAFMRTQCFPKLTQERIEAVAIANTGAEATIPTIWLCDHPHGRKEGEDDHFNMT